MEGQMQQAQRRGELLQRERQMTQARMHMALQDRGIYAYGDPTSAPYIAEAAARGAGDRPF
jgi:pyruvate/2-oxoglutarate dehydrogenase complex dihydrolipoamide dehydrogenase (E3) component